MRTDADGALSYLGRGIFHNSVRFTVAEENMNEVEISITPAISEVLRRIDSLKSTESISLEEKIRIAELILSLVEEESDGTLMVQ
jgi:hypothetical protein